MRGSLNDDLYRIDNYSGVLSKYVPQIRHMVTCGLTVSEMTEVLVNQGAGDHLKSDYGYYYSSRYHLYESLLSKDVGETIKSILHNMLRKKSFKKPWKKPRVFYLGSFASVGILIPVSSISRPIDMGGPRDVWQHWTPEMQYREFNPV